MVLIKNTYIGKEMKWKKVKSLVIFCRGVLFKIVSYLIWGNQQDLEMNIRTDMFGGGFHLSWQVATGADSEVLSETIYIQANITILNQVINMDYIKLKLWFTFWFCMIKTIDNI